MPTCSTSATSPRHAAIPAALRPERELLTPAQLLGATEEKLTAEEKACRERARITLRGFTRFDLSKDGTQLLVSLSGQLYVVNRASLKVTALPGKDWIDPRFSPDGTAMAAVAAGEHHVIDPAMGTSRALTTGATATLSHATAEFVAQEEMDRSEGYWWAPDSQSLAYQETDESAVEAHDRVFQSRAEAVERAPRASSTPGGLTSWRRQT
jgi:dipeptidyl-peptidase-4